jgi:alkylation response protein AidB-like acyl-CoA dehydrogenase
VPSLIETDGLTDVQRDILAAVREFVDTEILPVATELDHADEYPDQIVAGLRRLGVFGLFIGQQYGGLGESLLTYALVAEEIARGWMSISGIINTHFVVAYLIGQHGTEEQKAYFLPKMAAGDIRGRSPCRSREPALTWPRSVPRHDGTAAITSSAARRCG